MWKRWGLLAAVLLSVVPARGKDEKPKVRIVQVREAVLRSKPSFLGNIVARLKYEDEVEIVKERRGTHWREVKQVGGAAQGWTKKNSLHNSALVLKKGTTAPKAAGETTRSLAGRGFNEKVERKRRSELRAEGSKTENGYRILDRLVARRGVFTIDPGAVPPFVALGDLVGGK